ncbi:mycothiol synthase [Gephyromycinifex aptenodytis]|uniref:mycothiol synthase n=1 Tax=Gephyromycinifex aptenodytis TaxID=2716227 RepID=UPI001446F9A7|nr:mycothiol synthase [Gephyromycinifex aptenodytis]
MALRITAQLSTALAGAVRELVTRTQEADGVSPVSEQTLLGLHSPGAGTHFLSQDGEELRGYGFLEDGGQAHPSAEFFIAAGARRAGRGQELLEAICEQEPTVRIWAHANLPGAQALARSAGFRVVRELMKMQRPLHPQDEFPTQLPPGFTMRTFTPADLDPWLQVNSLAFASHPEQGRMSARDVQARMAEPWFDADGFFLAFDERDATASTAPRLAAFHWTKVVEDEGEVYVVGVHPDYQGLGLGRSLTAAGLAYLRDRGLETVTLYVEGDNEAALHTYRRQGFTPLSTDVMYTRRSTDEHEAGYASAPTKVTP